jgi:hypothetical protein
VDYSRESNTGLLTPEPTPKPPENMPGEGTTKETTANNSNTAHNKNDYNSKDGTVLTPTRHTYSP